MEHKMNQSSMARNVTRKSKDYQRVKQLWWQKCCCRWV